jgi:hypothetical protein
MRRIFALGFVCCFAAGALIAQAVDPMRPGDGTATPRDLWIHPRGATYDPKLHYRDAKGELYFHAENDIRGSLEDFRVASDKPLRMSIELGPQLVARARDSQGAIRPVFLWASKPGGAIDRSIAGTIEGGRAVFAPPADVDLANAHWQIGMRYMAGSEGDRALDRRYLASVDSSSLVAKLPKTPDVAAAPPIPPAPAFPPGLEIFKRTAQTPFDFDAFLADPSAHSAEFEALTKAPDGDDWTIDEDGGRLVTHYGQQDRFIVRAVGGAKLEILWGDQPLETYMVETLKATPDSAGCLNTRDVELTSEDGSKAVVPQQILLCPEQSFAFFDSPDGYETGLAALLGGAPVAEALSLLPAERLDATEAGTSIRDNLRLYAAEINPRNPTVRATGTVGGNVKASYVAAGDDLVDLGRHAFIGETRTHQHEGTESYRVSPIQMIPFALYDLVRLEPASAAGRIFTGVESGVAVVADAVSATNNAVIVPLTQVTVGPTVSPAAADSVGNGIGVVTSAVAKNLPAGERMMGAWSPMSFVHHDNAYVPSGYTRTDTQLNIDRLVSALDAITIGAVIHHNQASHNSSGGNDNGSGGNGTPGGNTSGGGGGGGGGGTGGGGTGGGGGGTGGGGGGGGTGGGGDGGGICGDGWHGAHHGGPKGGGWHGGHYDGGIKGGAHTHGSGKGLGHLGGGAKGVVKTGGADH